MRGCQALAKPDASAKGGYFKEAKQAHPKGDDEHESTVWNTDERPGRGHLPPHLLTLPRELRYTGASIQFQTENSSSGENLS